MTRYRSGKGKPPVTPSFYTSRARFSNSGKIGGTAAANSFSVRTGSRFSRSRISECAFGKIPVSTPTGPPFLFPRSFRTLNFRAESDRLESASGAKGKYGFKSEGGTMTENSSSNPRKVIVVNGSPRRNRCAAPDFRQTRTVERGRLIQCLRLFTEVLQLQDFSKQRA